MESAKIAMGKMMEMTNPQKQKLQPPEGEVGV
jgi:hypothetical protein